MADADTPVLNLPLDALHRALGARMVPFAGYAMPIQFEGIVAEHNWTRTHAGLFDVSHMGQLVFANIDDARLETLLPGDIIGLKQGVLRYSMLLDEAGGILDDLMVTRRGGGAGGDLYMVVNGATKHDDLAVFRAAGLAPAHRDDWALLALQGPEAVAVLERLAPGVAALSFMRGGAFEVLGHPAWISRSGYTGEDGFEISVAADAVEAVARALLAAPEVKPIGLGARDSLRLEAGLPLYGHDLTPAITPVEAGLSFAISKRRKAEGGFLGAARILDQLLNGPPKRRVGLKVEGRLPAREGATVVAAEGVVGTVTSGGFGPALGCPIAMAMVDARYAADGTKLGLDVRGRILDATVVPMPFFPKSYVRTGAPR